MNGDKINGIGVIFRFITPALIAIVGTLIIMHLKDVSASVDKLDLHFTNHMGHHLLLEKEYEHRITELEVRR